MRRALVRTTPLLAIALCAWPVISSAQRGSRGSTPPPAPPPQQPPASAPAPSTAPSAPARGGDRTAPGARDTGSQDPASGDDAKKPIDPPATPADRAADYFSICDYDGDGRLTYDEARASLRVDRRAFAVYDKDVDGLVSAEEFSARYEAVIAQGGAFPPPVKKPDARKAPRRSAKELLETYDQIPDLALERGELERAMSDYALAQPPADELLATLDRDSSRKLELAELDALADILFPPEDGETKPRATSVLELFGKTVPREERENAVYMPPQLPGPVPVFRRLDHDDDGRITLVDFLELQRPIQVHIRANAVFATLDADDDGVLSDAELRAALEPRRDGPARR